MSMHNERCTCKRIAVVDATLFASQCCTGKRPVASTVNASTRTTMPIVLPADECLCRMQISHDSALFTTEIRWIDTRNSCIHPWQKPVISGGTTAPVQMLLVSTSFRPRRASRIQFWSTLRDGPCRHMLRCWVHRCSWRTGPRWPWNTPAASALIWRLLPVHHRQRNRIAFSLADLVHAYKVHRVLTRANAVPVLLFQSTECAATWPGRTIKSRCSRSMHRFCPFGHVSRSVPLSGNVHQHVVVTDDTPRSSQSIASRQRKQNPFQPVMMLAHWATRCSYISSRREALAAAMRSGWGITRPTAIPHCNANVYPSVWKRRVEWPLWAVLRASVDTFADLTRSG